ncbi:hypothetical protein Tco_1436149 [Tanacetum coccineum]
MARPLFNEIVTAVIDHGPFFRSNMDCAGRQGISGLLKFKSAIGQLAYGVHADFLDEYMQISERTSRTARFETRNKCNKSSPLTHTGMADFVPGRVVFDAAQRKRDKYMTKCADIGYGFLLFSFSSLGELEADAVTLLKRIRKFSIAQDIGARATIHIFNAKGVEAQIVSRLPSNLL